MLPHTQVTYKNESALVFILFGRRIKV